MYPVSKLFKVIEGYDIYRSSRLIIALVAVETERRKDLRLYRWEKRKDEWRVGLCRMSTVQWNWPQLAEKAEELKKKHGITGN